jgi:hypothetical protein
MFGPHLLLDDEVFKALPKQMARHLLFSPIKYREPGH